MKRTIVLAALGILAAAVSGQAQERDARPAPGTNEIVIPSQRVLERDAATQPRNEFSTKDAVATEQMERQNQKIDREVEKGICTDC